MSDRVVAVLQPEIREGQKEWWMLSDAPAGSIRKMCAIACGDLDLVKYLLSREPSVRTIKRGCLTPAKYIAGKFTVGQGPECCQEAFKNRVDLAQPWRSRECSAGRADADERVG